MHDTILSIAKSKLNIVEVLISKALIYSNISYGEFILMCQKKKSKILIISKSLLYIKQCYLITWSVEKNTESKYPKVVKTKNGRIILLWKCPMCNSKKS